MEDSTAEIIADKFYSSWVARFGSPKIITSDQGSQFESILAKALYVFLGSQRIRTTAYHPAANGLVNVSIDHSKHQSCASATTAIGIIYCPQSK